MVVIGIDPGYGKESAYAVVDVLHEIVFEIGKLPKNPAELIHKLGLFGKAKPEGKGYKVQMVTIEGEYSGINVATAIKLATERGKIELVCDLHNLPHNKIMASKWQSTLFDRRTKRSKRRDDYVKLVSKNSVAPVFRDLVDYDIASAIQIALFSAREIKKEGLENGKK